MKDRMLIKNILYTLLPDYVFLVLWCKELEIVYLQKWILHYLIVAPKCPKYTHKCNDLMYLNLWYNILYFDTIKTFKMTEWNISDKNMNYAQNKGKID